MSKLRCPKCRTVAKKYVSYFNGNFKCKKCGYSNLSMEEVRWRI
jgi:tRNA(Ile2) C34 agmatinyltransferase TiaS